MKQVLFRAMYDHYLLKKPGRCSFLIGSMILVFLLFPKDYVSATTCSCKPEISAEATANGTCEVIKDDANWCKIKFNDGKGVEATKRKSFESFVYSAQLQTFYSVDSTMAVLKGPPETWGIGLVAGSLTSFLIHALWDIAPDRLSEIVILIKEHNSTVFEYIRTKQGVKIIEMRPYKAFVGYGSFGLRDNAFSVYIRTPWADSQDREKWKR